MPKGWGKGTPNYYRVTIRPGQENNVMVNSLILPNDLELDGNEKAKKSKPRWLRPFRTFA